MKIFEGKLVPQEIKIGIVAARFNEFITSKLLSGAQCAVVTFISGFCTGSLNGLFNIFSGKYSKHDRDAALQ